MSMGRQSRGGSFTRVTGGRPRRQLKWSNTNVNSSIVSGGTGLLSNLGGVLSTAQLEESTLVRTIICLTIVPAVPIVDSIDAQLTALGVGVAGADAVGVGGGSIANPSVASEEPMQGWLYQCMYWILEGAGVSSPPLLVEKDMRSSRKIGSGTPFIRFENNAGAGTPYTMRIVGSVRTLFMLA